VAKLPVYPGKSSSTNQNSTNWGSLMSGEQFTTGISEAVAQRTVRTAGTFSDFLVRIQTNTITASPSATYTFRKNGAAGSQAISVGASTTGELRDTSGTDAVVAADLVNFRLVTGVDATKSIVTTVQGCPFAATTNTAICHGTTCGVTPSTASATNFIKYCGSSVPGWTNPETATQKFKFKAPGTIQNGNLNVGSNGRGTSTTFALSINGTQGNIAISVAAAATGQFEDTAHSETVVSGTLVSRMCINGTGTATGLNVNFFNDFITTDSTAQYISTPPAQVYNAATTTYEPLMGKNLAAATETDASMRFPVATELSLYEVYVSANSVSAASTIRPRKNAANGVGAISVTANTTGWFEDTGGVDGFAIADEGNWQVVTGATGTSLTLEYFAAKSGPVNAYTLSVTQGSYAVTGFGDGFGLAMPWTQGSYGVTGFSDGLGISMAFAEGSYGLTGFAIGLAAARQFALLQGSYGITGFSDGLGLTLPITSGSYTVTGYPIGLLRPAMARIRLSLGIGIGL
jgi:hypothetical protein